MQAHIINYRGISKATIDLSKIALVAGANGAGKSSVCQAVAAALTGEPVPMDGVKKTGAGVLVRAGTAAGRVEIVGGNGTTEITWPAAKVKIVGNPPAASMFATGLSSIVTKPDKERVAFLIDYLHAKPTKEDLQAAVASLKLPDGTLGKLWELIELQGWDGAYSQIKEKGAKMKGQWEYVTNGNYGKKKAESWIPNGYGPDLEGASEETLKALVTDAKDAVEGAISVGAVDDSKRGEWQGLAGMLLDRKCSLEAAKGKLIDGALAKDLEKQLADARIVVADAQKALDIVAAELKNLEAPPAVRSVAGDRLICPECKTLLHVKGKLLERVADEQPGLVDVAGIADAKKRLATAEQTVTECASARDDIQARYTKENNDYVAALSAQAREIGEAERLVKESEEARQKLAEPVPTGNGQDVEQCRNAVALAETRLKAFTSKRDADKIHASIEMNQGLLAHIAPTGVRADVLTLALAGFNSALAGLSGVAGWPAVVIEPDLSWSFGGTPYYLCSESEKFRVKVVVQAAMAGREKAGALVVDGADILDKGGRNGLFWLLAYVGIPALVGMTIDARENVPNLAKAGLGTSYWLDGAVAGEI
jgi:energy-coupling factor transporter ATP-binding protein EcfA2